MIVFSDFLRQAALVHYKYCSQTILIALNGFGEPDKEDMVIITRFNYSMITDPSDPLYEEERRELCYYAPITMGYTGDGSHTVRDMHTDYLDPIIVSFKNTIQRGNFIFTDRIAEEAEGGAFTLFVSSPGLGGRGWVGNKVSPYAALSIITSPTPAPYLYPADCADPVPPVLPPYPASPHPALPQHTLPNHPPPHTHPITPCPFPFALLPLGQFLLHPVSPSHPTQDLG